MFLMIRDKIVELVGKIVSKFYSCVKLIRKILNFICVLMIK